MSNPHYVIREIAAEHWALSSVSGVGAGAGRTTYPTAQAAVAEAHARNPNASTEVQIRAMDERVPLSIRPTLVTLATSGYGQAGRTYHLTRHQLHAIDLTHDDIYRLIDVRIPFLGRTATLMVKQNQPEPGDASYELVVTLLSD